MKRFYVKIAMAILILNTAALFSCKPNAQIPSFKHINSISEGFAVVKDGDKYGYLNKAGKIVIWPRYDYADSFADGMAKSQ